MYFVLANCKEQMSILVLEWQEKYSLHFQFGNEVLEFNKHYFPFRFFKRFYLKGVNT